MNKKILLSIFLIILFIFIFNVYIESNTNNINLSKELPQIEKVIKDIIIDDIINKKIPNQAVIRNTLKIHEIAKIQDYIQVLYSYNYPVGGAEKKRIVLQLRVIEKNNSNLGYKLTGGSGLETSVGNMSNTPILYIANKYRVAGIIIDSNVSNIIVSYRDGKILNQNTINKDYFLIYRNDDEKIPIKYIRAIDHRGNIVYESDVTE
ncbi:hypothetical protein [Caloranaerobacter sp. DY30410]|uniref:hypothetical protein n=1 Tax=Caloranaerobacter sp. DY30410 TaxID=3238305 RepID=UPI003D02BD72